EDPREAGGVARVDLLRITDGPGHPLGGRRISQGGSLSLGQGLFERELFLSPSFVASCELAGHGPDKPPGVRNARALGVEDAAWMGASSGACVWNVLMESGR